MAPSSAVFLPAVWDRASTHGPWNQGHSHKSALANNSGPSPPNSLCVSPGSPPSQSGRRALRKSEEAPHRSPRGALSSSQSTFLNGESPRLSPFIKNNPFGDEEALFYRSGFG